MTHTTHHIDHPELTLNVHHWPAPQHASSTIVMLHGFLGSGLDFEGFNEALNHPHHERLAPDLPYHGNTQTRDDRPWDIGRTIDLLINWITDHIKTPTHLLGYSMGGRVALSLASRAPELCQSLTLIGATPGLDSEHARRARRAQDSHLIEQLTHQSMAEFLEMWRRKPVIASQDAIPHHWRARMRARREQNQPAMMARSLEHMGTGQMTSVWNALDKITCPTLLLTGQDDVKFTDIARDMLVRLPNARHHVIAQSGHTCHLERARAVADILSSFLDET